MCRDDLAACRPIIDIFSGLWGQFSSAKYQTPNDPSGVGLPGGSKDQNQTRAGSFANTLIIVFQLQPDCLVYDSVRITLVLAYLSCV